LQETVERGMHVVARRIIIALMVRVLMIFTFDYKREIYNSTEIKNTHRQKNNFPVELRRA
jgi:hypothetical protein